MGFFDMVDMTAAGMFVPASKFTKDDIPDQSGRVVIVTGANVCLFFLSPLVQHPDIDRLDLGSILQSNYLRMERKFMQLVDLRRKRRLL